MADLGYDVLPDAEEDLRSIWMFGAERWSVEQADDYTRAIFSTVRAFVAGEYVTKRSTADGGFVRLQSGSHHIYLTAFDERWEVVRVLHQRMDPSRHL